MAWPPGGHVPDAILDCDLVVKADLWEVESAPIQGTILYDFCTPYGEAGCFLVFLWFLTSADILCVPAGLILEASSTWDFQCQLLLSSGSLFHFHPSVFPVV